MSNQGTDHGGPVRYSHPERHASRCHHRLHPSSPRFPYCMNCTLLKAKSKVFGAQLWFRKHGGLSAPADARGQIWSRARLADKLAVRQIERAARRYRAHERRMLDWDRLHEQAERENTYEGWSTENDSVCPVCFCKVVDNLMDDGPSDDGCAKVDKTKAWWETPGKLVPDKAPVSRRPISPWRLNRRRGKRPIKAKYEHFEPSPMAEIILQCRIDLSIQEAVEHEPDMSVKAERAFRRKYDCVDLEIDPAVWSEPQSYYRMKPPPQPRTDRPFRRAPSKLSQVESIDDFEVTEDTLQREEEERMQRAERRARKEVGCLFLVGKNDSELAKELGADFFIDYRSAVRPDSGQSDELPLFFDDKEIANADAGPGDNDETPDLTEGGGDDDVEGENHILDDELYDEFLNLDTSSEASGESAPEGSGGVGRTGGFGF